MNLCIGQEVIDDFISAPFINSEVVALQKQSEYLKNENFNLPLFRELEVRLRSNDFNASPEDYRIRLGFINPYEQKWNKQVNEEHSKYFKVKYDFETNLILSERYKTLVRHFFFSNQLNLMNAQIDIYKNVQTVVLQNNYSLRNWLKADESLLKMQVKKKQITVEILQLENQMEELTGNKMQIDWNNIPTISVDEISILTQIDSVETTPEYQLLLQALSMKEKEYMLSRSEAWSNIGFIQAEYDTDRGNDLNKHIGFQLGLSIPVFNTDKPKIQREKLDLIKEEERLRILRKEQNREGIELFTELEANINIYKLIFDRLKKLEVLSRNVSYEDIEDYLSLVEYQGNLKQTQNEYMYKCLLNYIDILTISGDLISPPYENYLLTQQK